MGREAQGRAQTGARQRFDEGVVYNAKKDGGGRVLPRGPDPPVQPAGTPEGKKEKEGPGEDSWKESEKEWYYYTAVQVSPVSDKRYDRLKALYIKLYGGWDTIDLEHTTYDGHAWW